MSSDMRPTQCVRPALERPLPSKKIQGAHSATGTGERRCRLAHRADTGHWSATDLVTLAGTGALECHRSGDTANALGTGMPCYTRHLPPHTDQMLPSHPGLLQNSTTTRDPR